MCPEAPARPAIAEPGIAVHPARSKARYLRRVGAEWRTHWRVGLAALLGSAVSYPVWPAVSSLFVLPMQKAFGWSRGEVAFAFNASFLAGICAPVFGRLIDRVGVRSLLIVGLLTTTGFYAALAAMKGSLLVYYVLFALFTVCALPTTGMSYTRIVNAAFLDTRGLALALTRSGYAASSALLAPLLFWVITRWGWRAGYLTLAGLMAAIALPLAVAFVHDRPIRAGSPAASPRLMRALLLDRKVWLFCFATALNYAPILAILTQLQPLLVERGLAPATAATLVGLTGLAALAGTAVSGALLDRIGGRFVGFAFSLTAAAGSLLLIEGAPGRGIVAAAVLLIGLGQGAEIDVGAYLAARHFGLRDYSTVYGLSTLCIAIMTGAAVPLMGRIRDLNGDYGLGLGVAAAGLAGAGLCYLALGRQSEPTAN